MQKQSSAAVVAAGYWGWCQRPVSLTQLQTADSESPLDHWGISRFESSVEDPWLETGETVVAAGIGGATVRWCQLEVGRG